MLTIQNQTRAGKIFKCTIFVVYGGVIFFTGVAPSGTPKSSAMQHAVSRASLIFQKIFLVLIIDDV